MWASRLRRHVVKGRDAILSASRLRRHLDKHAKLFCRRNAYADAWLNGEMLFVGITATPTHFQCRNDVIGIENEMFEMRGNSSSAGPANDQIFDELSEENYINDTCNFVQLLINQFIIYLIYQ